MTDERNQSLRQRLKRWAIFGGRDEAEPPQCQFCRHHRSGACLAFPGGIPLAILTNQIDHRTEGYPLDRGLRFAPLSLEADAAQRALFDKPSAR
ncbi:MAG: hypothetical protein IT334_12645 [Thermomicrobiales bacterium]|nr:hypothetical protein [Thermomicrobiales bacterium]